MLIMNEHPKIVQQRLGHVKVETTLDIYSHVRPQVQQESAQRFSDFLKIRKVVPISSQNLVSLKEYRWKNKKRTLNYQGSKDKPSAGLEPATPTLP